MAAGGVAVTGSTGEDYTIPLVNAIVLETTDPQEIEGYVLYLRDHPNESHRIRQAARRTARMYTWEAAIRNLIGKLEHQARLQGILGDAPRRLGHQGLPRRHHNHSAVDQGSPHRVGKTHPPIRVQPEGADLTGVGAVAT
jgi:hypothetical protein